jgi:hypothetical protein
VIPSGIPLLLPNTLLRVQVSLAKTRPRAVNGYVHGLHLGYRPSQASTSPAKGFLFWCPYETVAPKDEGTR